MYDVGGDGFLSIKEIKEAIPGIDSGEIEEFLAEADTNQDRMISFQELKQYLLKRLS